MTNPTHYQRILSPQHQLKLVLLGEFAVGKTSFLRRFVNADFAEKWEPTVGAGFLTKTFQLSDKMIKMNCWDTAGQDRFHSLAPMYYRGAQTAIVMYDVTKQATFGRAKIWIRELQRQAPPHIVIALVGNKIDLCDSSIPEWHNSNDHDHFGFVEHEEHQDRQVTREEASQYAAESGLLFFETSARLNFNVEKVFTEIAQHVPVEYLSPIRRPSENNTTPPPSSNSTTPTNLENDGPNTGASNVNLSDGQDDDAFKLNESGCMC
ncbi:unnamed protein product [Absidia cylindrospora]